MRRKQSDDLDYRAQEHQDGVKPQQSSLPRKKIRFVLKFTEQEKQALIEQEKEEREKQDLIQQEEQKNQEIIMAQDPQNEVFPISPRKTKSKLIKSSSRDKDDNDEFIGPNLPKKAKHGSISSSDSEKSTEKSSLNKVERKKTKSQSKPKLETKQKSNKKKKSTKKESNREETSHCEKINTTKKTSKWKKTSHRKETSTKKKKSNRKKSVKKDPNKIAYEIENKNTEISKRTKKEEIAFQKRIFLKLMHHYYFDKTTNNRRVRDVYPLTKLLAYNNTYRKNDEAKNYKSIGEYKNYIENIKVDGKNINLSLTNTKTKTDGNFLYLLSQNEKPIAGVKLLNYEKKEVQIIDDFEKVLKNRKKKVRLIDNNVDNKSSETDSSEVFQTSRNYSKKIDEDHSYLRNSIGDDEITTHLVVDEINAVPEEAHSEKRCSLSNNEDEITTNIAEEKTNAVPEEEHSEELLSQPNEPPYQSNNEGTGVISITDKELEDDGAGPMYNGDLNYNDDLSILNDFLNNPNDFASNNFAIPHVMSDRNRFFYNPDLVNINQSKVHNQTREETINLTNEIESPNDSFNI